MCRVELGFASNCTENSILHQDVIILQVILPCAGRSSIWEQLLDWNDIQLLILVYYAYRAMEKPTGSDRQLATVGNTNLIAGGSEAKTSAAVSRRLGSKWPKPAWHAPWKNYRVISSHLGYDSLEPS